MQESPIYQAIASQAADNPGFRITSLLEWLVGNLKSFIDTPEERATAKAAIMLAYDSFIGPRVGNATVLRSIVDAAVDQILATLGS